MAFAEEGRPAQSATVFAESDFPITDAEFLAFRDLFYRKTGVLFAESKRYFVDRRIVDRAVARGAATFKDYFTLLKADATGIEFQALINLLTVNETYFFRENYQMQSLARTLLPQIARRKKPGSTIRIWSMPCSTGEEPYSIAMTVLEDWSQSDQYEVEILASDIDTRVLADAAKGIYGERSLMNVSPELRSRYFRPHGNGDFQIIRELRSSIDFSRINLTDTAQMSRIRDVDVVFCRNLLIYFDDAARRTAVAAIFESLTDGGFLYLGHSESLGRIPSQFESLRLGDSIVYQRHDNTMEQ